MQVQRQNQEENEVSDRYVNDDEKCYNVELASRAIYIAKYKIFLQKVRHNTSSLKRFHIKHLIIKRTILIYDIV